MTVKNAVSRMKSLRGRAREREEANAAGREIQEKMVAGLSRIIGRTRDNSRIETVIRNLEQLEGDISTEFHERKDADRMAFAFAQDGLIDLYGMLKAEAGLLEKSGGGGRIDRERLLGQLDHLKGLFAKKFDNSDRFHKTCEKAAKGLAAVIDSVNNNTAKNANSLAAAIRKVGDRVYADMKKITGKKEPKARSGSPVDLACLDDRLETIAILALDVEDSGDGLFEDKETKTMDKKAIIKRLAQAEKQIGRMKFKYPPAISMRMEAVAQLANHAKLLKDGSTEPEDAANFVRSTRDLVSTMPTAVGTEQSNHFPDLVPEAGQAMAEIVAALDAAARDIDAGAVLEEQADPGPETPPKYELCVHAAGQRKAVKLTPVILENTMRTAAAESIVDRLSVACGDAAVVGLDRDVAVAAGCSYRNLDRITGLVHEAVARHGADPAASTALRLVENGVLEAFRTGGDSSHAEYFDIDPIRKSGLAEQKRPKRKLRRLFESKDVDAVLYVMRSAGRTHAVEVGAGRSALAENEIRNSIRGAAKAGAAVEICEVAGPNDIKPAGIVLDASVMQAAVIDNPNLNFAAEQVHRLIAEHADSRFDSAAVRAAGGRLDVTRTAGAGVSTEHRDFPTESRDFDITEEMPPYSDGETFVSEGDMVALVKHPDRILGRVTDVVDLGDTTAELDRWEVHVVAEAGDSAGMVFLPHELLPYERQLVVEDEAAESEWYGNVEVLAEWDGGDYQLEVDGSAPNGWETVCAACCAAVEAGTGIPGEACRYEAHEDGLTFKVPEAGEGNAMLTGILKDCLAAQAKAGNISPGYKPLVIGESAGAAWNDVPVKDRLAGTHGSYYTPQGGDFLDDPDNIIGLRIAELDAEFQHIGVQPEAGRGADRETWYKWGENNYLQVHTGDDGVIDNVDVYERNGVDLVADRGLPVPGFDELAARELGAANESVNEPAGLIEEEGAEAGAADGEVAEARRRREPPPAKFRTGDKVNCPEIGECEITGIYFTPFGYHYNLKDQAGQEHEMVMQQNLTPVAESFAAGDEVVYEGLPERPFGTVEKVVATPGGEYGDQEVWVKPHESVHDLIRNDEAFAAYQLGESVWFTPAHLTKTA